MVKQWNAFDPVPLERQSDKKPSRVKTRYVNKCDHCDLKLEFKPYWCIVCKDHHHNLFMGSNGRKQMPDVCSNCRDKITKGLGEWITTNLWIPAWLP